MYNPTQIIHNQNLIMHNLVMCARHTLCIIHFLHIQTHTLCIIQDYVKCVAAWSGQEVSSGFALAARAARSQRADKWR
jgi:hypothetical protein